MNPQRWKEIRSVFEAAAELPAGERDAFLDTRCGADRDLRAEVESLLDAHDNTRGFLGDLSVAVERLGPLEEEETAPIGTRVGPWQLVKEIGRGGMGSVYLAERADSEFRKRVAVKLIRQGMESTFAVKRFKNERQILARLEHPNIARLIDGGTTGRGYPYLVMELVEGEPLLQYCETRSLPVSARLDIFRKVCSAVQYAHRRMIVHRDLKPANVLVKKDCTPKLLDFGVAKLVNPDTSDGSDTMAGVRMVTPAYASPEQMRGERATPKSDIFSLGVILSELVAGVKPAALAAAAAGTLHTPARTDIHPSRVGDLRHIVLRAARHDPADRYESVDELLADLDRYMSGLPVAPYTAPRRAEDSALRPAPGSIAVLPFHVIDKQTGSDAFLATGITDAIITRLGAVGRITVRPTSAVLRYAETADAVAAGYELNVEFVLEGAVQRSANRVRATVQLVSVRDGSSVWAEAFDSEFDDLLAIEDRISQETAEALVPQLTGQERLHLAKRGTASAKAHEAYLRGRHYWNAGTEESLAQALIAFMQAVDEDPEYALAHAGIADYYLQLGMWGGPPPAESFAAAKAEAEKALSIDPLLAEGHAAFGFATWACEGDWESASHHLHMAITLKPEYANAYMRLAMVNSARGRHDVAAATIERGRQVDPESNSELSAHAFVLRNARRFQEAIRELEGKSAGNAMLEQALAWSYLGAGRVIDALNAARRAAEAGGRDVRSLTALAAAESATGNTAAASAILAEVRQEAEIRAVPAYNMALLYLAAGKIDGALRQLRLSREQREWWIEWLNVDPRLDALRAHPGFATLDAAATGVSPAVVAPGGVRGGRRRWRIPLLVAGVLVAALEIVYLRRATTIARVPFSETRLTKLTIHGTSDTAAISADGKLVAYTGTQDGKLAIWIRAVDNPTASRIAVSDGGDISGLQFSDDGQFVYFASTPRNEPGRAALCRVSIVGGPVQRVVTELPGPAALTRDGKKLAYLRPDPKRGLDELIVSNPDYSNGRTIASRRYPDRFTWTSAPAWSEDGRRIAAGIEGTDNRGYYVKLMSVDAGTGTTAVPEKPRFQFVERVAWMPRGDGMLAIGQHEDSSFQQAWYIPYGGGEPKKIGNDLNDYFGVSIASDGMSLVTVQVQTMSNVYVLPPDGRIRQLTPGSGRYFDLAWTPDGRIAYASDASGQADIWIMNGDGSGQKQLTTSKGRSYSPAVSPDGKTVVFHSNRSGNWNIWRMDLDGRNLVQLTHDIRDSNWPQFSADGQYIVYHHAEPNAMFNLYRLAATGGTPEKLTTVLTTRPDVAADGRIACWYSERIGTPSWKMAVLPAGGGAPIRVFDLPPAATPDTPLRWTPSGDGITYIGSKDGVRNIYVQPVDGRPAERLTNFNSGQIYSVDWSKNGKLAYSRGMSSSDVVLIRDLKK